MQEGTQGRDDREIRKEDVAQGREPEVGVAKESIVELMKKHRTACASYQPKIAEGERRTSPTVQINHYGL